MRVLRSWRSDRQMALQFPVTLLPPSSDSLADGPLWDEEGIFSRRLVALVVSVSRCVVAFVLSCAECWLLHC